MSEVTDPAAAHRLLPAGIGLHRLHRGLEVPSARLGPRAGHRQPGTDCAVRQRYHGLTHQALGPVVQHDLALPARHPAGQLVTAGQLSLGRLAQHRGDEHRAVRELRMRARQPPSDGPHPRSAAPADAATAAGPDQSHPRPSLPHRCQDQPVLTCPQPGGRALNMTAAADFLLNQPGGMPGFGGILRVHR